MEGAFEDAGFGFEEDDVVVANTQALSLSWAFGFSKDVKRAVIDLSNETRRAAFYLSAHTGVIYDYTGMQREQHHLQGHCNPITSACHDLERRFIATGDAGPADTLVVVWDAVTATPIKSIFDPHAYGVAGMDMSPDGQFLATLSAPPPPGSPAAAGWVQEIAVWEWHEDTERPRCTATVNLPAGATDSLTCIRFNPTDVRQLITHSNSRVSFWQWRLATDGRAGSLASFSPPVNPRDFGQALGAFTDVAFLPPRDAFMASSNGVDGSYDMTCGAVALSAVSCTKDGDLLLWEASTLGGDDALPQIASWHATKLLNICKGSVMCLTVVAAGCPQPWLVAGCADGAVRVYDYQFRVISWFEKIDFSAITSLSFAMPTPQARRAKIAAAAANTSFVEESDGTYNSPAFVVGTSAAVIVALSAADANKAPAGGAATIGTVLAQGMATAPTSIVGHPTEPFLAIGTQGGNVHLWNLDQRRLVNIRRLARDEELELKDAIEASKSATRDFRSANAGEAKAKARAKASKAKRRVARARTAMQQLEVTCCAYNAPGTLLAVGTANGRLLLLHSGTLEELGSHDVSADSAITHIRFSSDGIFLATADTDRCVAVFRYKQGGGAEDARGRGDFDPQAGWVFIGKNRSHTESIADLQFSQSESELDTEGREYGAVPLLASVGADRRIAVYDLGTCSISSGLRLHRLLARSGTEVQSRVRAEDSAVPTAALWTRAEGIDGKTVPVLAVANDEFKIRMWGARAEEDGGAMSAFIEAKQAEGAGRDGGTLLSSWRCKCRSTVLGSTHGGPIASMMPLDPNNVGDGACVVFCSTDKVVGLARLPFTGNPNSLSGTVAHPTAISSLTVVKLGPSKRCVVTAGGADMSVLIWDVDVTVLDAAESVGGRGITPFLAMLNDGAGGDGARSPYDELVDYVVYSQLQRQGERCTSMRSANRNLPIGEVPQLLRAMGYYPSQWECELVATELELRLRKRLDDAGSASASGQPAAAAAAATPSEAKESDASASASSSAPDMEAIPLFDLIRVYVNHRPLTSNGVTAAKIEAAFRTIASVDGVEEGSIRWNELKDLLVGEGGEAIATGELLNCMRALVSERITAEEALGGREGGAPGALLPTKLSAKQFASEILGFA